MSYIDLPNSLPGIQDGLFIVSQKKVASSSGNESSFIIITGLHSFVKIEQSIPHGGPFPHLCLSLQQDLEVVLLQITCHLG